jgi:hypothetical protein
LRARALVKAASAAVILAACGGNPGPSQSGAGGGTVISLRLTTSGDGIVRGTGSDCRGTCVLQEVSGAQLQLQAIPDQGASFTGWSGPCTGSSTACPVTVDGDTAVTAAFSRPGPIQVPPPAAVARRLSVTIEGSGRVVSSPANLDCDSTTCQTSFPDGARVSLAATPAAGFFFSGWGGAVCSGSGACGLTLASDAEIFAHFQHDDSNRAGPHVDGDAVDDFQAGSLLKRLK